MNNSPAKASLRNVSIDIWRILAIFLVMTNHYWGLLSDIQVSRFKIVNFLESGYHFESARLLTSIEYLQTGAAKAANKRR